MHESEATLMTCETDVMLGWQKDESDGWCLWGAKDMQHAQL